MAGELDEFERLAKLNFHHYQGSAAETAIYPGKKEWAGLAYTSLGMAGEAGEFAGKVKKIARDDNGVLSEEKREALIGELGDVLWYVAACAEELGVLLADVAQRNLDKLASRQERGVLGGSGDNR